MLKYVENGFDVSDEVITATATVNGNLDLEECLDCATRKKII
jgi:hypothetical protein